MSFKIAFIGAGSVGFTRTLLRDLLSVSEFRNISVSFHDINAHNMEMTRQLCQRDLDENGVSVTIQATTNRREGSKTPAIFFAPSESAGLKRSRKTSTFRSNTALTNASATPCALGVLCTGSAASRQFWTFAQTYARFRKAARSC